MDIWQIVVIVVLAALILVWVAVIAYNKGRVSGRLAAEQDLFGDEDTHSSFGDDAPVRPTERRLIEVLPESTPSPTATVWSNIQAPAQCHSA